MHLTLRIPPADGSPLSLFVRPHPDYRLTPAIRDALESRAVEPGVFRFSNPKINAEYVDALRATEIFRRSAHEVYSGVVREGATDTMSSLVVCAAVLAEFKRRTAENWGLQQLNPIKHTRDPNGPPRWAIGYQDNPYFGHCDAEWFPCAIGRYLLRNDLGWSQSFDYFDGDASLIAHGSRYPHLFSLIVARTYAELADGVARGVCHDLDVATTRCSNIVVAMEVMVLRMLLGTEISAEKIKSLRRASGLRQGDDVSRMLRTLHRIGEPRFASHERDYVITTACAAAIFSDAQAYVVDGLFQQITTGFGVPTDKGFRSAAKAVGITSPGGRMAVFLQSLGAGPYGDDTILDVCRLVTNALERERLATLSRVRDREPLWAPEQWSGVDLTKGSRRSGVYKARNLLAGTIVSHLIPGL